MNKKLSVLIVVLVSVFNISGQDLNMEELFKPKMPKHIDTLYYPFYNGVQMIEVDHLAYWDKKIFFLEQSQPRALEYSMLYPPPVGNAYFFRDSTGKIVKAFNTSCSLDTLTEHFSNIPLNKRSNNFFAFLPHQYHRSRNPQGVWVYSPQPMFLFNGYYKISNTDALTPIQSHHRKRDDTDIRFGLIDTLGNIRIPVQYEEILPLNENLIVKRNGKWGIMDKGQNCIVPLQYDWFSNYYSEAENNKCIYFMNAGKYVAVYDVKENLLIAIDNYDRVHDLYLHLGYLLVEKNNLYGLIDLKGEIALPVIYKRINNVNRPDCRYKKCVNVEKGGKTYDVKLKN